ncbi:MAG: hypothetical protein AAGG68_12920 [Bacteroidota bacterium]
MKNVLYLLAVATLGFWACEGDSTSSKNYLVGTWEAGPQTLRFFEDSNATMIIQRPDGPDTMLIWYKYAPDSTPAHLDLHVYEHDGALKGMRLFGLMEIVHRDTFRTTSEMGFEGQGYKYRPKTMEERKTGTYVRVK